MADSTSQGIRLVYQFDYPGLRSAACNNAADMSENSTPAAKTHPDAIEERALSRSQLTAVVAIIVAYAGASYYSDSRADAPNLAAGLSVAPVALIGLALVWRWTPRWVAILTCAITAAMLWRYWEFMRGNYQWSNLLQQVGAYGVLALGFGRSLAPGVVPLCTQMADRLHGPLTPAEVLYTRHATLAWAIFYALLTATIAALFFVASARIWSLFVNFGTFGSIALMFVVEHSVRRTVLPSGERGSTLVALRQFLIG